MKLRILNFLIFLNLVSISIVFAFGEVTIEEVQLKQSPPFQYKVVGKVSNQTPEPREVVLRAQVVFLDKAAPKTDLPVHVLRKDTTLVLRGSETRNVEVLLIQEGHPPDVRYQIEPVLRLRRQRLWLNQYEDLNSQKKESAQK